MFGALSDRVGRRPLLIAASLVTAAYRGGWTLVSSFSMGSALFFSGLLRDAIGWNGAWLFYAVLTLAAGLALRMSREWFLRRA